MKFIRKYPSYSLSARHQARRKDSWTYWFHQSLFECGLVGPWSPFSSPRQRRWKSLHIS